MDFVTPLYQTLQAQANLDHTRSVTQDTQALAQQRQQNVLMSGLAMQRQMNTQQAMAEAFRGWNPDDPSFQPAPDDTAVDAARKNAARLDAQANFARKAAALVAQRGGDPNFADKMIDDAAQAGWRAAQAKREALAEDKNLASQMSGIAAGVKDTDSLIAGMQQLSVIAPRAAKALATQLDTDPYTGTMVYGPKSEQVMRTIRSQGMTADQQAKEALKIQDQQDRERRIAIQDQDEKRKALETDARVANLRASTSLHEAQAGQVGKPKAVVQKPLVEATTGEKDSARNSILAEEEFKDAKFDGSLPAFASDVANRAKKISRDNPSMSKDEAQQQALDELKGFVTDRKVGEKEIPIIGGKYGGEMRKTYTRGGAGRTANAPPADVQEGRDGKKYQFIGGPNGDRQDKSNWKLIGG